MAAKITGSTNISETMRDSIEIPTTNSGFSLMTSSIKVYSQLISTTNDYQKLKARAHTIYIIMSGCRSSSQSLGVSLFELGVAENVIFDIGTVILPLVVQEI